LTRRNQCN